MAVFVNQEVIRFDITVNIVELVDGIEGKNGFCNVEARLIVCEGVVFINIVIMSPPGMYSMMR